jgi:hypothetical protein
VVTAHSREPADPGDLDLPVAPPRPARSRPDGVALQAFAIVLVILAGLVKISVAYSRPREVALTPALVAAAPRAARTQRSARAELTISVAVSGQTASERGQFQLDFEHSLASADFDLRTSYGSGDPRHLVVVTRDEDAWLRVPDGRLSLNEGKPWVAVKGDGTSAGTLTPGVTSDPTGVLDRLTAGGATPVETGREDVRGVPTVKYHVDISVADALAQLPDELRRKAVGAFGDAGVDTLGYDVWIDHAGLPRRVRNDIDMSGGSVSVVIELFDYGRPVAITVPADTESRTVPTLADAVRVAGLPTAGLTG